MLNLRGWLQQPQKLEERNCSEVWQQQQMLLYDLRALCRQLANICNTGMIGASDLLGGFNQQSLLFPVVFCFFVKLNTGHKAKAKVDRALCQ